MVLQSLTVSWTMSRSLRWGFASATIFDTINLLLASWHISASSFIEDSMSPFQAQQSRALPRLRQLHCQSLTCSGSPCVCPATDLNILTPSIESTIWVSKETLAQPSDGKVWVTDHCQSIWDTMLISCPVRLIIVMV